jgi:hypothetical protein
MRWYVNSRINPNQRIYVTFGMQPAKRENIPYETFFVTDLNGVQQLYTRRDVWAETGTEPAGVALVIGALLFIVDPLLGIIAGLGSGILANQSEADRVRIFNQS